jgi:hypothetical protein
MAWEISDDEDQMNFVDIVRNLLDQTIRLNDAIQVDCFVNGSCRLIIMNSRMLFVPHAFRNKQQTRKAPLQCSRALWLNSKHRISSTAF